MWAGGAEETLILWAWHGCSTDAPSYEVLAEMTANELHKNPTIIPLRAVVLALERYTGCKLSAPPGTRGN